MWRRARRGQGGAFRSQEIDARRGQAPHAITHCFLHCPYTYLLAGRTASYQDFSTFSPMLCLTRINRERSLAPPQMNLKRRRASALASPVESRLYPLMWVVAPPIVVMAVAKPWQKLPVSDWATTRFGSL